MSCRSEGFVLCRDGDDDVVAKRREYVMDGIVTGIIVDLLAFPLLSASLILGVWMLVGTLTREHAFHLAPQLNHFASPSVVRAAEAALPVLMGIMFAGGSVCLLPLLLRSQAGFSPYQCRFKKGVDGSWTVQRKLWFLSSPWRKLGDDWKIWCYPSYSRGDWGYLFLIKTKRARLVLAMSGAIADSKSHAKSEALKDLGALKALLGISGELKRWN